MDLSGYALPARKVDDGSEGRHLGCSSIRVHLNVTVIHAHVDRALPVGADAERLAEDVAGFDDRAEAPTTMGEPKHTSLESVNDENIISVEAGHAYRIFKNVVSLVRLVTPLNISFLRDAY